jgi:hypothetical protein
VEFINNGKSLIKRFDKKLTHKHVFPPPLLKPPRFPDLKELLVGHNTIPKRSQTTEKGRSSDRNLGGKLYLSTVS